jgi:hypothetical protein
MELECSLPLSQESATWLYRDAAESSPNPHILILLLSSCHVCLDLSSGFFPSGFLSKILYALLISHMSAARTVHLILLDFITQKYMWGIQIMKLPTIQFSQLSSCLYLLSIKLTLFFASARQECSYIPFSICLPPVVSGQSDTLLQDLLEASAQKSRRLSLSFPKLSWG